MHFWQQSESLLECESYSLLQLQYSCGSFNFALLWEDRSQSGQRMALWWREQKVF